MRRSWSIVATAPLALALLAVHQRPAAAHDRLLPWRNLAPLVGPVEFGGPEHHRFRKQVDFATFLRHVETGTPFRVPVVDFARYEVFSFAVGPRSSTGYRLRVREVRSTGDGVQVVVDEQTPTLARPGRPALTFPFVLVRLPRSDAPVSVVWPQQP